MHKLTLVTRTLLGLVFFVFGLNGFLHFLPAPPLSGPGGQFIGALAATGYMFPLIKGTEVLGGLALLSGRYVPLALTVLAPVIVNIVAFHVFLSPGGFAMLAFLLVAETYLAWAHRDAFRGVLAAQSSPRWPTNASSRVANSTLNVVSEP